MGVQAVLHKGLLTECVVCNPPTVAPEKRERRKKSGKATLDVTIRRQVAFDLGEEEPQKDERFQLLQKYGVAAPRIDRQVTKPKWMGETEFKRKMNDWFKITKGLVVATQQRKDFRGSSNQGYARTQVRSVVRTGLRTSDALHTGRSVAVPVQVRQDGQRPWRQSPKRENS